MIHWIRAARLRTLPLSVSGIIMGSFIARWRMVENGQHWDWRIFALALLVTLLYQVLSNFANDYGDGVRGTDKLRIEGAEVRAVAAGHITSVQMRNGVILFALLSLLATVLLLFYAFLKDELLQDFLLFVGLGFLSILASVGYTVGKKPYGYFGLGDIMVFLFFGLVSVCGSYYLFTKSLPADIFLPATAIGMCSAAVLNLNNMRDIENDALSGKRTLALRLGFKNAMIYEVILLQLPVLLVLVFMLKNELHIMRHYYAFIFFILVIPFTSLRRNILKTKEPRLLDPFLKQVGILTLVLSLLVAFGLNYFTYD